MAKTPKLTYAKIGDTPIVTVTRMCERCGFRPVQGGKKSKYCKPCTGEAVSAACKKRDMRPKVAERCACGKPVESKGSKFCPSCNALRNAEMLRLHNPMHSPEVVAARKEYDGPWHNTKRDPFTPKPRQKIISDAEQRRIDHAAYNSDISTRAEHNPLIMARLMRGAVVQSLPVGHAEAGEVTRLEDIPDTPRSADVAFGW